MAVKVKDIVAAINDLAPENLAMEWDSVGLQIGSMEKEVETVFVALDLDAKAFEEAHSHHAQMIVTHHPFLFTPLKSIRTDQPYGDLIRKLLHGDTAVYAAHTNMDIARGGLNDWVAGQLELTSLQVLEVTTREPLVKLVVFVPESEADNVAEALSKAGAGQIGNYSHCTFRSAGTGTFKPLEGSTPFIGQRNQLERVPEIRLETILPASLKDPVLSAMKEAHPYEEVAYDLFPLEVPGIPQGIGRMGMLKTPLSTKAFASLLKRVFRLQTLRWAAGTKDPIAKVAVLTGSGASAIQQAAAAGCDALITGDVKYHDAQHAESLGLHLFDAGHFETEVCFVEIMEAHLRNYFREKDATLQVIPAKTSESPLRWI